MQAFNWNDAKYLLALIRTGSLAKAGDALGVSETTVARRIKALEQALGQAVVLKGGAGHWALTEIGASVEAAALRMEAASAEIAAPHPDLIAGEVRVSSVPMVLHHVIVPRLGDLLRRHPNLAITLLPESRESDLTRREADIALRFARPKAGGDRILAQKVARLDFALYRASEVEGDEGLIAYDASRQSLPQARWLEAEIGRGAPAARLRVTDLESAQSAIASGLGQSLLPSVQGDADPRLRRANAAKGLPLRELWMLSHRDNSHHPAIDAVKTWISDCADGPLAGKKC